MADKTEFNVVVETSPKSFHFVCMVVAEGNPNPKYIFESLAQFMDMRYRSVVVSPQVKPSGFDYVWK